MQTARGRRASMVVACLSLYLYLLLVGPHYYARRRRQLATGVGAANGGGVRMPRIVMVSCRIVGNDIPASDTLIRSTSTTHVSDDEPGGL